METGDGTNYDKQLFAHELNRYFTDILQKREDRKDSDSVTFEDSKLSNFVSSRLNAGTTFGIPEIIPKKVTDIIQKISIKKSRLVTME